MAVFLSSLRFTGPILGKKASSFCLFVCICAIELLCQKRAQKSGERERDSRSIASGDSPKSSNLKFFFLQKPASFTSKQPHLSPVESCVNSHLALYFANLFKPNLQRFCQTFHQTIRAIIYIHLNNLICISNSNSSNNNNKCNSETVTTVYFVSLDFVFYQSTSSPPTGPYNFFPLARCSEREHNF